MYSCTSLYTHLQEMKTNKWLSTPETIQKQGQMHLTSKVIGYIMEASSMVTLVRMGWGDFWYTTETNQRGPLCLRHMKNFVPETTRKCLFINIFN